MDLGLSVNVITRLIDLRLSVYVITRLTDLRLSVYVITRLMDIRLSMYVITRLIDLRLSVNVITRIIDTYCNVAGGDLATIESKEEEAYIESELRKVHGNVTAGTPENYWLDGSDILAEGEWRWMSEEGNSRLIEGYTSWSPGQPDNAGAQEHCLEIRFTFSVLWNDYQCQVQQNFICKTT
ncbi:unnamed protein product [Mytilus coruscus]|uniref:C-type lectin domain-containing protein n=1 Tax=Mytilus coruscus TaxID=42192 RepID=A0A6J8E2T6_MYTCO|nr:unnamed protein product [Mytilus coruscus]